jgi:hypothetical protein
MNDDSRRPAYCPPGFRSRILAMTELIRWGPSIVTHAELHMLLFYAERTLSYGKLSDASSWRQITNGIFSRKKREWIRGPSGLSGTAAKNASKSLAAKGFLVRRRAVPGTERYRPDRGNEATEWEINWAALREKFEERRRAPVGHVVTKPLGRSVTKPLGHDVPHNRGKSSSEKKTHRSRPFEDRSGVEGESGSQRPAETDGRPAHKATKPNASQSRDDDEKPAAPKSFLSPKHELAYLCEKRGQVLSEHEWRQISEAIELHGIDPAAFCDFVRPHLANPKTKSPLGMIKSKIKNYRAMNKPAVSDSDDRRTPRVEKCPLCGDLKGQGARFEEGKFVPCECASDEWRAKIAAANQRDDARTRAPDTTKQATTTPQAPPFSRHL